MSRADVNKHPHATDPVLSQDIVRRLAGRFLADRTLTGGFEVDESGGEARVYLLGEDIVVKTQRPHRRRPSTSLRKEAEVLDLLASSLSDRIPRLHGYGTAETEMGAVEFLVMSRVPGRPVVHRPVTGARREQLLADVAATLRGVHAADLREMHDPGLFPDSGGDDAIELHRRFRDGFADLVDVIAVHPGRWSLSASPDEVMSAALAALPSTLVRAGVLLHSEPGPSHVFVDAAGSFTGVIDFGDAYRSHPALDLRGWPDPADRVTLSAAYLGSDSADTEFEAVWTVAMIQADMTALVRRADSAEQAGQDLAVRLSAL
jgi:aminoglycoside phosphotransferase (APT) family kinase protein